jgi:hypothetical protein
MQKIITFFTLTLLVGFFCSSMVFAHGVILSKSRTTEENKIEMVISSDETEIVANKSATYKFRPLPKEGEAIVPYDSATVTFVKPDGTLIFSADLQGSNEFASVAESDAAMPSAGPYTVKIAFKLPKIINGEKVQITSEFDFTVKENAEAALPEEKKVEQVSSHGIPKYAIAVIFLLAGGILGRFSHKLFTGDL